MRQYRPRIKPFPEEKPKVEDLSLEDLSPKVLRGLEQLAKEQLANSGTLYSARSGQEYELRGDCKKMVECTDHESIIVGPRDCIAGETIIEGTGKTIQELCETNTAPLVQTMNGPRRAGVPFKKAKGFIYEVRTESGSSFLATKGHLVLSPSGFVPVGRLNPGQDLLLYEIAPPLTILEPVPSIRALGALCCSQKVQDFQLHYFAGSCLCDGQFHPFLNSDRSFFPLQDDVPLCSHDDPHLGDLAHKGVCNHLHQLSYHPSILDFYTPSILCEMAPNLVDRFLKISELFYGRLSQFLRWCLGVYPLSPSSKLILYLKNRGNFHSCEEYRLKVDKIASVKFVRYDDYYDLTVPDVHHYFAGGCIHHNTGKTMACCIKAHLLANRYKGCQGAIIRKTQASMAGTVLQTFSRIIEGTPVSVYGGQLPQWYDYPNGSRIWVGGMDNPDKVLSSERDFIYVCQAEELIKAEWEFLAGSASGRAGNIPHPQIFGDCNPAGSRHWIKKNGDDGTLTLFKALHKDNPTLYTVDGTLTLEGKTRLDVLAKYTGMRRKRLFEGLWVSAEGVVYDMFDSAQGGAHVKIRDPREMTVFYLAMDEGYTNPQTNLLIGSDSDKRWHIFKEFYVTQHLESEIVAQAKEWFTDVRKAGLKIDDKANHRCRLVAVDNAAAGLIAALKHAGLYVRGGKGRIIDGIYKIQDRLKVQKDGKARLTVDPGCVETINEFESYTWKPEKDVPIDENNHSMACLRYLNDVLEEPSGALSSTEGITVGKSNLRAPHFIPRRYVPNRRL